MQQTPCVDFNEGIYRYRFQGTIFADARGLPDLVGPRASRRASRFPPNYGDVHVGRLQRRGIQARPRRNDQKAFQVRGTLRPAPAVPVLGACALTGFYDSDHYVRDAKKRAVRRRAHVRAPVRERGLRVPRREGPDAPSTKAEIDGDGLVGLGDAADSDRARGAVPLRRAGAGQRTRPARRSARSPASRTGSRSKAA